MSEAVSVESVSEDLKSPQDDNHLKSGHDRRDGVDADGRDTGICHDYGVTRVAGVVSSMVEIDFGD